MKSIESLLDYWRKERDYARSCPSGYVRGIRREDRITECDHKVAVLNTALALTAPEPQPPTRVEEATQTYFDKHGPLGVRAATLSAQAYEDAILPFVDSAAGQVATELGRVRLQQQEGWHNTSAWNSLVEFEAFLNTLLLTLKQALKGTPRERQ